jgi:glutamate--cysteine ligase
VPAASPTLDAHAARQWCEQHVFAATSGPTTVGIELEWLTSGPDGERIPLDRLERLIDTAGTPPAGGRFTIEPGGQLELSTATRTTVDEACAAAAADLYLLDSHCAAGDIELVALGADPERNPERVVTDPRYQAMQAYFDTLGSAGRTMMCNTAALQINIGHANEDRLRDRWRIANALGPTLIACFANSPLAGGVPTGWQSSRLRSWWMIDPSRSAPVPSGGDPVTEWLVYALAAEVMLIRVGADDHRPITSSLTFEQWMAEGHELGYPTIDDLAYHLTTLFPPVRPKGWLELRMFDTLPTPFWHVATAVTFALLADDLLDEVAEAVDDTRRLWVDAAQLGLGHPALARSARRCFELALEALESGPTDSGTLEVVGSFRDRWVRRGRCPADDRLDAWRRDGTLWPRRESPVRYVDEILTGRLLP